VRRTSLAAAAAALALGAMALTATTSAHAAAAQFGSSACPDVTQHEDAAQDGYNCSQVSPHASKLWSTTLSGSISYPVIADGRVFVTTYGPSSSYGGDLYALNAQTGKVEWGPVALSGTYYYFPLTYDNGQVFVNDFDGTLRAFNASTGKLNWSASTTYFSSEPVAYNGMVWVNGSGTLEGVSQATGAIEAQSPYLNGGGSAPAINGSGVYLSTTPGCESQYKLSFKAAIVWNTNGVSGCSGGGSAPTALWGNLMYGGAGDMVVNQSSGKQVGTFSGVPAFSSTRGFFTSTSTGYFASGDKVSALNVSNDNSSVWTANLSSAVVAGPVATSDAVWVGTASSTLVALNPQTGAVLNTIQLPGAPGGGGPYSGTPSDIGVGNNMLVAPTGSTITAYGSTGIGF
jgi:outer membrane protein assembly factor BamB